MEPACLRRPGPPLPPVRQESRVAERRRAGYPARRPLPARGAPRGGGRHDVLAGPGRAARPAGRACACCPRPRSRPSRPSGCCGPRAGPRSSPTRGSCGSWTPSEVDGVVYVVSEWVAATSLVDLLADGPLPPAEARDLALDIADALERGAPGRPRPPVPAARARAAHQPRAGQGRRAGDRRRRPRHRAGQTPRTRHVGTRRAPPRVAYAALTARWPGGPGTGLPAAPHDGPTLCTPRQVRAGVPHDLDVVVARALQIPGAPGGPLGSLAAAHRGTARLSTSRAGSAAVPGRAPDRTGRRLCRRTTRSRARAAGAGLPCWPGPRPLWCWPSGSPWPAASCCSVCGDDGAARRCQRHQPVPETVRHGRGDRHADLRQGGHHLRPAAGQR